MRGTRSPRSNWETSVRCSEVRTDSSSWVRSASLRWRARLSPKRPAMSISSPSRQSKWIAARAGPISSPSARTRPALISSRTARGWRPHPRSPCVEREGEFVDREPGRCSCSRKASTARSVRRSSDAGSFARRPVGSSVAMRRVSLLVVRPSVGVPPPAGGRFLEPAASYRSRCDRPAFYSADRHGAGDPLARPHLCLRLA